jgi:hypothetical protein
MSPVNRKPKSPNGLSDTELRLLARIADQIFPSTDTPGASECGAIDYIKLALAGDYANYLSLYRRGLRAVDRHSRRRFGATFSTLDATQQDLVLADFEAGNIPDFKKAAEFFETVRYHVLEGIFCEPQYGGNKDMTGWRLVHFPGQQPGYPDAYINKEVDLPPIEMGPTPRKLSDREQ